MAKTEYAWVIEHRRSEVSAPEYWTGNGWSKDHMSAVRFVRQLDAARTVAGWDEDDPLPGEKEHRLAQHGWG